MVGRGRKHSDHHSTLTLRRGRRCRESSAQGAAVRDCRRALAIAPGPVLAQSKPSTNSREASGAPTEAALAVGAPQIGSVANLEVAGFDIAVTAGSIVYSYYFTNKGNADLAVAASASLNVIVFYH